MAAKKKQPETAPAAEQAPVEVDIETVLAAMASVMKHQADLLETQSKQLQELLERIPPRVKLGN